MANENYQIWNIIEGEYFRYDGYNSVEEAVREIVGWKKDSIKNIREEIVESEVFIIVDGTRGAIVETVGWNEDELNEHDELAGNVEPWDDWNLNRASDRRALGF